MRDISTDDLIRTLLIAVERRVRADDILRIDPAAKNASAVRARQRDERNALRALNTHLKECARLFSQASTVKMPPGYVSLKRQLPQRTVNALRSYKVTQPEKHTVRDLCAIPGIGVQGVAHIAARTYSNHNDPVHWPELSDDD